MLHDNGRGQACQYFVGLVRQVQSGLRQLRRDANDFAVVGIKGWYSPLLEAFGDSLIRSVRVLGAK